MRLIIIQQSAHFMRSFEIASIHIIKSDYCNLKFNYYNHETVFYAGRSKQNK